VRVRRRKWSVPLLRSTPHPNPPPRTGRGIERGGRGEDRKGGLLATPFSLRIFQTFSGVNSGCRCGARPGGRGRRPRRWRLAGGAPTVADSPTPLAPNGWCGDGVTVWPGLPFRVSTAVGTKVVQPHRDPVTAPPVSAPRASANPPPSALRRHRQRVVDALAHLGVRHIDIPITPEKV